MLKENKSLFVLYAVFISYSYFGYVDIVGSFSSGNILLLLIGMYILVMAVVRGTTTLRKDFFIIISSFFLLCVCYLVADLLKGLDTTKFALFVIKVLIIPTIALVTGSALIKGTYAQEKTILVFIIVIGFSAVVAVLQFIGVDAMWKLRLLIQAPEPGPINLQFAQKDPVAGLAFFNVQLCYQLVSILPFAVGMYCYALRERRDTRLYGICLFIILLAVIISKSVSAVLGAAGSLLYMYILLKQYIYIPKKWIISLIALSVIILITTGTYIEFTKLDSSAYSRLPLAAAGILSIIDNPLGHGSHEVQLFEFINLLYNMRGSEQLEMVSSHNSFINLALATGWVGLALGVSVYAYLYRLFRNLMKEADNYYFVCLYASAIGFLVGYFLQSFVHNAGLFNGDVLPWIIVGAILSQKELKG